MHYTSELTADGSREPVVRVNDVSMRFLTPNDRITSLKEFMISAMKGSLHFEGFTALEDISFEVKKGEVVGIVGKNGAGKSTLLKIISGVLTPTTGTVNCKGTIVPMLELGAGFDMELSGKENIFLNGAIMGYSREFLESKYEEIVWFSELEQFIETPIRNYSSGMMMRLAFSIAAMVDPEILIVDEILSVGDEGFQKKSRERMMELMSGGTTVLFVSHSIHQVREMCSRVIWLDKHKIRMDDRAEIVCDEYENYWKRLSEN